MKYIIASLTGAIIGYFTNWVAIKMLFRPYTEKRIFGIKIPFTPGLIPKERQRIAKSVGDTVSNHLLTEDTLIENINNNDTQQAIGNWIEKSITEVIEREKPLGDEIRILVGDDYDESIAYIKGELNNLINTEIKNPEFSSTIAKVLDNEVEKLLQKKPKELLSEDLGLDIKEFIANGLSGVLNSSQFHSVIGDLIHHKIGELGNKEIKLQELLTEEVTANIKVLVFNNRYKIAKFIENLLEEEKYEIKIKSLIDGILTKNLNPMIAMFINSSIIYEKLNQSIKDMLKDDEKIVDIVLFINEIIDNMLQVSVKDLFSGIPTEGIKNLETKLINIILDNINERNIELVAIMIKDNVEKINTIEELLKLFNVNKEKRQNYINHSVVKILNSDETEKYINNLIDLIINKIENVTLKYILGNKSKNLPEKIAKKSIDIYSGFVNAKGIELLRKLNISKIVEENINKFDVVEGEKIILDIAKKELGAITWLGGLLGAIIGILSPILAQL